MINCVQLFNYMEAPTIMDIIDKDQKSFNLIYCSSCKSIPKIKIKSKGNKMLFSKICKCKPELDCSINDLIKKLFNNKEKKLCQKDKKNCL